MTEAASNILSADELTLTLPAQSKMAELVGQVEEEIQGIRVYATSGGCSGVNFGMTFTDQLNDGDKLLKCDGFDVIVDDATMQHLAGVEIDFTDQGDGNESFMFNNLQSQGSGCGTCGSSQGGGCG